MKITIKYPAFVTDTEDNLITSDNVLEKAAKQRDKSANLSDETDSYFEDLGLTGGKVTIEADIKAKRLYTIIHYHVDEGITNEQINALVEHTTGQLTDGYGEMPWQFKVGRKSYWLCLIALFSNQKIPTAIYKDHSIPLYKKLRRSPIFATIENEQWDKVDKLLSTKDAMMHLCSKDKYDNTPLIYAINRGNVAVVLKMISLGADVSRNSGSPILDAARLGNVEIGKALIANGADIDEFFINPDYVIPNLTPLMRAVGSNNKGFVELLLANGADINKVNDKNETAIMFAGDGSEESCHTVEPILKLKPNLDVKDWRGRHFLQEALDRARCSRNYNLIELICKYYDEIDFE